MEKIKQGQRVEFNVHDKLQGVGKIVGKAKEDLPIVGGTYIIEPDEPIINESYPYTHFVLFENQFKLI